MMRNLAAALFSALLFTAACTARQDRPADPAVPASAPTPVEAAAFIESVDQNLHELYSVASRAGWVKETYITDDTEAMASAADERAMEYVARAIKDATRFDGMAGLDPDVARQLTLLKVSTSLPAPKDAEKRAELARLSSRLVGLYGKGEWCPEGAAPGSEACQDLEDLSRVIGESRDPAVLLAAWERWRTISPPMKPMYERFVELGNEGAREIGFDNLGVLWRSRYDMPPEEFEAMTDRLWEQVRPLYERLHCYVRKELSTQYPGAVQASGTLPAHVLGNMWAQSWANIYPLVEPYPGHGNLDVTAVLEQQKVGAEPMVRMGESFFTSLGLEPLPATFWERSMFTKPADRDVVCHASAWDITYAGDVRIKMCIRPTEEDLITIHHELGHIYYFLEYKDRPILYQDGANDGFHEAIGDAVALSVTPSYLEQRGVLTGVKEDERAVLNVQMRDALEKIAFLPFGKLIDQWRWDVFSGRVAPEQYNEAWWALRQRYQGVHAPTERGADAFDPGAKFHIPANVPYMRYFLAHILQFQFHRSLCQAAGHKGPLHTCSIFDNKEAGVRLQRMLAMGASRPWPDALEAVTGQREMDASALVDYFAPLSAWLEEKVAGEQCGW
jgi:peptidyl-dipeptidase A